MIYDDVNHALPILSRHVMGGHEVGSRQGERTRERLFSQITLDKPLNREVTLPGRKASLPAQIAETMWVLAGRNDIGWLSHYLPRAADFSDDGETWRAGYGPRIRRFEGADAEVDQLAHVVSLLRQDHTTRRAVISLWDPVVDSEPGKDIACNNWLHFIARDGNLNLNVTTRSNDLWWGWSGINQFEWSALLEIVAGMTGLRVGALNFNISSLHIYEKHWERAEVIGRSGEGTFVARAATPRFDPHAQNLPHAGAEPWDTAGIGVLDKLIEHWFDVEELLRSGVTYRDAVDAIGRFPEPMLRSWLRVVAWWWSQDSRHLDSLTGTALAEATHLSPLKAETRAARKMATSLREAADDARAATQDQGAKIDAFTSRAADRALVGTGFIEFADQLHREKGKAYGDSWKKRGEQISILANIARKIDRLGVAGAGDTAADTVIDLLIYLIKYRWWLWEEQGAPAPFVSAALRSERMDEFDHVLVGLNAVAESTTPRGLVERNTKILRDKFDAELRVDDPLAQKVAVVDTMIKLAGPLAHRLWLDEQNATRAWSGYGE